MQDKDYLIKQLITQPLATLDDNLTEEDIVLEYMRIAEYQQLKTIFDNMNPNISWDLWLWISNILILPQKDPIFFQLSIKNTYVDKLLLLDNDILIKKAKELVNDIYIRLNNYKEELKSKKLNYPLNVTKGRVEVTLRRKGMGVYGMSSLLMNITDYNYLKNLIDGFDDIIIERYILRYSFLDKNLTPKQLNTDYYNKLSSLGVKHQIFASPQDHYFESYGSEYYEVDKYFGSVGSILKDESAINAIKDNKICEVNMLHYGPLHTLIIPYLDNIINKISSAIVLYIVYDININTDKYEYLTNYAQNLQFSPGSQRSTLNNTKSFLILKNKKGKLPSEKDLIELYKYLTLEPINNIFKTLPILTPYEKAYAIAERGKQLGEGSQPLIDLSNKSITDVLLVAEMELEAKVMPYVIKRPDGDWDINKLIDYDSGNYKYNLGLETSTNL